MKYYVYAGYYENFISGHKLPKPYTLRDEFKTFDEALDYVLENWEDDDIFFTEDVIDDAIDNGVIDDENWEDYLMKESKKSARKSIKESINANSILSKVETIVGKTKIKHPKAEIIELDGTKYIYYSYFDRGFDDDALDRVWDKCSDLKGVVDVGFGYGYGLENTKYENSLLIELDDDVIVESKKSARKSLREMFDNEGIVDDFVDFLIYDCGYDEKTVEKYFYKKYKLNGLDVIPIKLYIQIKNEIEDVLGYNDII